MSFLPILYLNLICFITIVLHTLIPILNAIKMLSKTIKKYPSKSMKHHHRRRHYDHHHHRRKISSSISMVTRINKSISTCHRRLVKFFSKLTRNAGDLYNNRHTHKGFKVLKQESTLKQMIQFEFENDVVELRRHLLRDHSLLPPLNLENRRTVFLDLDETLVHSCPDPAPKVYDFIVWPKIAGKPMKFYVLKRPGLDKFLEEISKKYEVVVFTAGVRPYAKLVLDHLDPKGVLITHRLYRDSCRRIEGKFMKDLSRTGRDLGKVVILDDNPNSYSLQPENGIPINPFLDDVRDRELERLMGFFETCDFCEDMRDAVKQYVRICDDFDVGLSERKLVDL